MDKKKQIGKPGYRKFRYVVLILLLWILVHAAYVTYDGLHDYAGKADIAVILGNMVYADSSLSPWLKGRVDKALELYRTGRVKKIFASGGKGEYHVREGFAMKRYLLGLGMPSEDIIPDNDGINTYFTARDFMTLDSSMHFSSVIVVSSFYHITRTKYIFRKLGFKNTYGVSSDRYFRQDAFGLFREFFAFYKYVLFY